MSKIRGNEWNRRICKWIASLLTVALLVNQSSLSVLAEEINEVVCQCDTRCSADSVNAGCPVCAQDYGRCEGAEDVPDTDTGEEAENPDVGEDVDTETGAETGDPDAGIDTDTDEETEESDADENDTDADTEIVSDEDAVDEGVASFQDEVAKNANGEDAVSRVTAEGRTFDDGELKYRILSDDGRERKVEVTGCVDGISPPVNLVIPSSASNGTNEYEVVSIGDKAFTAILNLQYGCRNIKSITIPDSVTSIEKQAFYYCSGLTSVTIPDSVNTIGQEAFSNCSSLTSITIPGSVNTIGQEVFANCSSLTSVTIPGSVNTIEKGAFGACSSLTSITIPGSVNSIGTIAFCWCSSLTSVTIPDSVNSVGEAAFKECSSLTNVTILNDKIKIGRDVFENCKDLTSLQIALPENITGTPSILDYDGEFCMGCPDDRSLTFLTEDGTTELSETTTPKLSRAVEAYNAVDDGGINDGYWYGWKLPDAPDVPDETNYTITASAGTGGSVSPSGEVPVKSGANQQFTITPDEGYRVSSVLVDGVEQLSGTQTLDHSRAGIADAGNGVKYYDFENVTGNHTLTAAFAATSTGGGGSGDTGDDDDPDDNNGGGGSGGGGSTGGGGSGGGGGTGGGSGGGGDTGGGSDGGGSDGSDGGDTGGGSDNSGGDSAGSSSPAGSGKSAPTALSDKSVKNGTNVTSVSNTAPASKDSEPKTGDVSHMEIYATIAMIAGLSYILLYFADGKNGMTEEEKKEIVAALVAWAKNGSRVKKYAALAVIFLILVYYHSIGKRTTVDWKEVYEK